MSSEKELNAVNKELLSSCGPCLAFNCPANRQRWEHVTSNKPINAIKDVTSEINAIMALETMDPSSHKEDAWDHLYADM